MGGEFPSANYKLVLLTATSLVGGGSTMPTMEKCNVDDVLVKGGAGMATNQGQAKKKNPVAAKKTRKMSHWW